jgi:hypothetical protein
MAGNIKHAFWNNQIKVLEGKYEININFNLFA